MSDIVKYDDVQGYPTSSPSSLSPEDCLALSEHCINAVDNVSNLQADRHRLILWTAREGQLLTDAVEFCRARGLEFYAINSDVPSDSWKDNSPTRKLKVDMFIDDRNLGGLPDWSVIYEMISRNLTYGDIIRNGMSELFDVEEEKAPRFFRRIIERCRSSREKYNHGSSSGRRHRSSSGRPKRSSRGSHHW